MPDAELQEMYAELRRRGALKGDPETSAMIQELVKRGELADLSGGTIPKGRAYSDADVASYLNARVYAKGKEDSIPRRTLDTLVRQPRERWQDILKGYSAIGNEALRVEASRIQDELAKQYGSMQQAAEEEGRQYRDILERSRMTMIPGESGGMVIPPATFGLIRNQIARRATQVRQMLQSRVGLPNGGLTGPVRLGARTPIEKTYPGNFFPETQQAAERTGGFVPTAINLASQLSSPENVAMEVALGPLAPLLHTSKAARLGVTLPLAAMGIPGFIEAAKKGDPGGAAANALAATAPILLPRITSAVRNARVMSRLRPRVPTAPPPPLVSTDKFVEPPGPRVPNNFIEPPGPVRVPTRTFTEPPGPRPPARMPANPPGSPGQPSGSRSGVMTPEPVSGPTETIVEGRATEPSVKVAKSVDEVPTEVSTAYRTYRSAERKAMKEHGVTEKEYDSLPRGVRAQVKRKFNAFVKASEAAGLDDVSVIEVLDKAARKRPKAPAPTPAPTPTPEPAPEVVSTDKLTTDEYGVPVDLDAYVKSEVDRIEANLRKSKTPQEAIDAAATERRQYIENRVRSWAETTRKAGKEADDVRSSLESSLPGADVRVAGSMGRGDFFQKGRREYDLDFYVSGAKDIPASGGKSTAPLPKSFMDAIRAARKKTGSTVDVFVEHEGKLWVVEGRSLSRKPGAFGKGKALAGNVVVTGKPMPWSEFEPEFRKSIGPARTTPLTEAPAAAPTEAGSEFRSVMRDLGISGTRKGKKAQAEYEFANDIWDSRTKKTKYPVKPKEISLDRAQEIHNAVDAVYRKHYRSESVEATPVAKTAETPAPETPEVVSPDKTPEASPTVPTAPAKPKPTAGVRITHTTEGGYNVDLRRGDIIEHGGKQYMVDRRNGYMLGVDELTPNGPKVSDGLNLTKHEVTHTGRNWFDENASTPKPPPVAKTAETPAPAEPKVVSTDKPKRRYLGSDADVAFRNVARGIATGARGTPRRGPMVEEELNLADDTWDYLNGRSDKRPTKPEGMPKEKYDAIRKAVKDVYDKFDMEQTAAEQSKGGGAGAVREREATPSVLGAKEAQPEQQVGLRGVGEGNKEARNGPQEKEAAAPDENAQPRVVKETFTGKDVRKGDTLVSKKSGKRLTVVARYDDHLSVRREGAEGVRNTRVSEGNYGDWNLEQAPRPARGRKPKAEAPAPEPTAEGTGPAPTTPEPERTYTYTSVTTPDGTTINVGDSVTVGTNKSFGTGKVVEIPDTLSVMVERPNGEIVRVSKSALELVSADKPGATSEMHAGVNIPAIVKAIDSLAIPGEKFEVVRARHDAGFWHKWSSPLSVVDAFGKTIRTGFYERVAGPAGKFISESFRSAQRRMEDRRVAWENDIEEIEGHLKSVIDALRVRGKAAKEKFMADFVDLVELDKADPKRTGAQGALKKALEVHDRLAEEWRQYIINSRNALGYNTPADWGITKQGYFRHLFLGDIILETKNAKGEWTAIPDHPPARTYAEAQAQAHEYLKTHKGADLRAIGRVSLSGDMTTRLSSGKFWKLVGELADRVVVDKQDILDDIRGIIGREAGKVKYLGALLERKGKGGYSKAYSDVMRMHSFQVARSQELTRLNRLVVPMIEKLRKAELPGLADEVQAHLNEVWGIPAKWEESFGRAVNNWPVIRNHIENPTMLIRNTSRRIATFQNILKLRFNVRSASVNVLQPMTTLAPYISVRDFAGIYMDYMKPQTRARLRELGVFEGATKIEGTDVLQRGKGLKHTLANPFNAASAMNRGIGYLFGERQALRWRGPNGERATPSQVRINGFTWAELVEFDNSEWNAPPILRSPAGRVFGQFRGYTIKNLEQIFRKNGSLSLVSTDKPLAQRIASGGKFLAAQTAIGGLKSIPGAATVLGGYAFMKALKEDLKRRGMSDGAAEAWATGAYYGSPAALFGSDLSSSIAILEAPYGNDASEQIVNVLGPTTGMAAGAADAFVKSRRQPTPESRNKEWYKYFGRISSYPKQYFAVADMITGKKGTVKVGQKELETTRKEDVLRFLGFTLVKQTKGYDEQEWGAGISRRAVGEVMELWKKEAVPSLRQQGKTPTEIEEIRARNETEFKRAYSSVPLNSREKLLEGVRKRARSRDATTKTGDLVLPSRR